MKEEQALQWLVDYIDEHREEEEVKWSCENKQICAKSFAFLHGYSLQKMYKARQISLNEGMVPIGVNRQGIERGPKKLSVRVWIAVYCSFFADYRPDKNEIYLPCHMT